MTDTDFVLGFIAGEGTFTLSMNTADGRYYPRMRFQVRIHERDRDMAFQARETFGGVGTLNDIDGRSTVEWVVRTKDDLEFLRDKIEAYAPDIWHHSEKARNFDVWSDILDIHIDGATTADQAIEMCKLARDGLNVNNGINRRQWNEYIESLEERA